MKNSQEPATLSIQYDAGDTTSLAFSDFIHWNNVLAEKNIWARKPIPNMRTESFIRAGMFLTEDVGLTYTVSDVP